MQAAYECREAREENYRLGTQNLRCLLAPSIADSAIDG